MSRLDRLVVLLDTGSTQFIRNTAADQLSDLAKGHPEETINLLGRIYPFLKSTRWETRIAAARAFGGIVNHSDVWDPNSEDAIKKEEAFEHQQDVAVKQEEDSRIKLEQDEELEKICESFTNLLTFEALDIQEVLKSNKKLLACDSEEVGLLTGEDQALDNESFIFKLKKHKSSIVPDKNATIKTEPTVKKEKEDMPIDTNNSSIVSNSTPENAPAQTQPQQSISNARLKAMQKRKAKVNAKYNANKIQPVDLSQSSISRKLAKNGENSPTCVKDERDQFDIISQLESDKLVVENKPSELSPLLAQQARVAGLVWQFQGVFELLIDNLFDDRWEIRHGAALGLRELIKKHGKGAGRVMNKSREENDRNNSATLEDLAVRLCTLFALDRFGDYVSDTVVAPVRESGAQTLAALLIHLDEVVVLKTFNCLKDLVLQDQHGSSTNKSWEAKHGGMLGLRYFVSVRTDVLLSAPAVLDTVVDMVLHGLKEIDDDVQSVAALTLAPIASEFVKTKQNLIHTLLSVIWDSLTNLRDDLSASIGSVMDLLSKLCTHKEVIDIMQKDAEEDSSNSFENLVPRLYPFLRHSITNVRKAVLRTILEFLSIKSDSTKKWIDAKIVRLIFQNLLVEQNKDVLSLSSTVYDKIIEEIENNSFVVNMESIFGSNYQPLLTLLMTPIGIARNSYHMNTNLIIRPSGHILGTLDPRKEFSPSPHGDESNLDSFDSGVSGGNEKRGRKRKYSVDQKSQNQIPVPCDLKINIDAPIYKGEVLLVGYDIFVNAKCAAAAAYGKSLSSIKDEALLKNVFQLLVSYLNSPHSTPRLFAALVIKEYADALTAKGSEPPELAKDTFFNLLMDTLSSSDSLPFFRELVPTLKSVRTACLQLFEIFMNQGKVSHSKIPQLPVVIQGESEAGPGAFGIEYSEKVVRDIYPKLMKSLSPSSRITATQALEDAKHRINVAISETQLAYTSRLTGVLSTYASAVLALSGIPKKLNPIIRSLMDSVKQENTPKLQDNSAIAVAHLIRKLNEANKKNVADKIVKNLCAFLCVDTSEVPEFGHNIKYKTNILSLRKDEAKADPVDSVAHEKAVAEARIKRHGAILSLKYLLDIYKERLFEEVPKLNEIIFEPLNTLEMASSEAISEDTLKGQSIIDALGVLRAILPMLDTSLYDIVTGKLPLLLPGIKSDYSVFRYSTSKCLATISSVCPTKAFTFLVKSILPMLNNAGEVKERQGAIECVYHLSSTMAADILPYIVFLIVPILGRMSDADSDVRVLATTTFAAIIKLVPLEAGIPDPHDMPEELLVGRDREREFIQQMMDPSKAKPFELPVSIKATLRKYQQDGVNWLAFLNKYHLHGILCDDMGLGKTLQTICIIASDHYMREEKHKETKSEDSRRIPSLIVCPPSLTGHWEQEFNQYAPFLTVSVYAGSPSLRFSLRPEVSRSDIVVTSYDVCRNDIDFLEEFNFNYCVLDEGHIIKNSSSKLTKSVKRLRSEHRLVLSGTPIQNNVLELWSLFDFLMPGFLGTEKLFNEKFAKPIAASRSSKTSSKEQEAGALALESLHKQVLPFMLRRLKEDVLSDLPPKIIQDYYCELSDLQKQLYKDFAEKQKLVITEDIQNIAEPEEKGSKTHVFQALQYMRKLCNHPALVLLPDHPKFKDISNFLKGRNSDLKNIEHSPKLLSLKSLLLECGIGSDDSEYLAKTKMKPKQQVISSEGVISEHRALIFCQLKDMLDIVENDLLKKYMPSVTYTRLDGSTDPRERQSIVRKFNEDPSIDVLLLTTKVGGLGLNLTGADTVIFVEHDWNPMNDLQAMDRAHRIGQKKVVNVYRLITKNTLEEKIMGLQKFKMNIASTIVNQQNSGLASMDTKQLLDLFNVQDTDSGSIEPEANDNENSVPEDVAGGLTGKAAGAVGELAELWDESQYEEEYNLDNFIKTLK